MDYQRIGQMCDNGQQEAITEELISDLQFGRSKPEDFSVRELAEATVPDGKFWVKFGRDPRSDKDDSHIYPIPDLSAFQTILGCILETKMLEYYNLDDFVVSELVTTTTVPYITEPDPHWGCVISVTPDAIFYDRMNLLLSRASEIGEVIGFQKEKRVCDLLVNWPRHLKRANMTDAVAMLYGNPKTLLGPYNPIGYGKELQSRLLYRRIVSSGVKAKNAKKHWFIGDFEKAILIEESHPLGLKAKKPVPGTILQFRSSLGSKVSIKNERELVKCTE